MCWIEVPNYRVAEEVQARLDSDPTAVVVGEPRRGPAATWTVAFVAFLVGAVVGWLWRY